MSVVTTCWHTGLQPLGISIPAHNDCAVFDNPCVLTCPFLFRFQEASVNDDGTFKDAAKDSVFEKGQSKRIWGELYKVLDSSDVVIQVGWMSERVSE
jgi:hypothetical protein